MPAHSVSPVSSIAEALDRWRGGDRVEVLRSGFLDVLASVPDPRDLRGRRYPLDGLLAIAILAPRRGWTPTPGSRPGRLPRRSRCSPNWGSGFGDQPRRRSERYFNDWIRRIWTAASAPISPRWPGPRSRRGQVAGGRSGRQDAARGASGRSGRRAPGVGFAHRARLVLGQLAVAEKSNEIPCVRKILHPFRQVRLLVTVDAMHTQTATAKLICGTLKSHYLMIVKSNQPKLLARVTALPRTRVPVTATDDAHGHGRVERRTLKVLTAARGIGFPYAKQIIQITRERVTAATGERTREVVYESAASHSNTPGRR